MGSADEEQGELPRDARPERADERGEGEALRAAAEPTGAAHANGTWRRWRWWLLGLVALFAVLAIALLSARRRPPAPPSDPPTPSPSALGQVASRIGAVHGDVIGIEILERGGGSAIDDLGSVT